MRKLLYGSVAALVFAAIAMTAMLSSSNASAQEPQEAPAPTQFTRILPLDDVLAELTDEGVIDQSQANAIRNRFTEKIPFGGMCQGFSELFGDDLPFPPGPPRSPELNEWLDQMGGHMQQWLGEEFQLPEGLQPPPGPPGSPELNEWLDQMHQHFDGGFSGSMPFHHLGTPGDAPNSDGSSLDT